MKGVCPCLNFKHRTAARPRRTKRW